MSGAVPLLSFCGVYGVCGDNFTFAADEVDEGEVFVFRAFIEHSQSSRLLFVKSFPFARTNNRIQLNIFASGKR